jgi:CMP-N-acetylneuraminic acid synthetase
MSFTPRIVAFVPMRHMSERVPGKNYRPFAGDPLYHHIVRSLLRSGRIVEVVIDTDSPVIMADARANFPEVRLIERPEFLRGGDVPMNDILVHDVNSCPADFYLQTHSTNPLLRSATIARAVDAFLAAYPRKDSLFSVTRLQTRLWDNRNRPLNHDPERLLRTQDLAPVYEENSNLYIFTAQSLRRRGNRIGERPLLFEIGRDEAWDIDEELDFRIAEFLCRAAEVAEPDHRNLMGGDST